MFTPAEYREAEMLTAVAYLPREPSTMKNMPKLNSILDTTFDFNKCVWTVQKKDSTYELTVTHPDYPDVSGIEEFSAAAWDIMAERGRMLLLDSAQILAAAKLLQKIRT